MLSVELTINHLSFYCGIYVILNRVSQHNFIQDKRKWIRDSKKQRERNNRKLGRYGNSYEWICFFEDRVIEIIWIFFNFYKTLTLIHSLAFSIDTASEIISNSSLVMFNMNIRCSNISIFSSFTSSQICRDFHQPHHLLRNLFIFFVHNIFNLTLYPIFHK